MKYKILYPVVISFLLYVNISESVVFNVNGSLIASLFLSSILCNVSGDNTRQFEEKIRYRLAHINAEGRSLKNDPSRMLNPKKKVEAKRSRLQRGTSDCEKENEKFLDVIDKQKQKISKLQESKDLLLAELNNAYGKGYDVVKEEQKKQKEENKQLRRQIEAKNLRLKKCKNKADKWKARAKSYKKQGKN